MLDPASCLKIRGPRSGICVFEQLPLGVAASAALFQGHIEPVIAIRLVADTVKVYRSDVVMFSKNKNDRVSFVDEIVW